MSTLQKSRDTLFPTPPSNKIFVVLGATGSQGGVVCRHLLQKAKDSYTVRAVTRNPSSTAARSLKRDGAEVVQADMSDRGSLKVAFKGAHAIFSVTDFFASVSVETEISQGVNVIEAAITAASETLECFLWSSLPDPRSMEVPYHNVLHFNTKSEISKYLKSSALWKKSTIIWVTAYFENYTKFAQVYGPQPQEDGSFKIILPIHESTKLYETCIDDLGPLTHLIASDPTRFQEKTVTLATSTLTAPQQIRAWADVLRIKKKVSFQEVTLEQFISRLEDFGFAKPMATELAENFAIYRDNPEMWVPPENIKSSEILSDFVNWETFVEGHDWSGLLEEG